MDPKELQIRQEIRKVIQKAMKESSDLTEGGLTGWVIDKISSGLKWAVNRKADYQYDGLVNSKEFRSLASKYGYSNAGDFIKRAKELIKKEPKKFAKILAYDVRDSTVRKYKLY